MHARPDDYKDLGVRGRAGKLIHVGMAGTDGRGTEVSSV